MNSRDELWRVLKHWFIPEHLRDVHVSPVTGGMSGALVWRINSCDQNYCLRRWPQAHPHERELVSIHNLIRHVSQQGIGFVPLPHLTLNQLSYINHGGHPWELSRWLPGKHVEILTQKQLTSSFVTLARVHSSASTFEVIPAGISQGLDRRQTMLRDLLNGKLAELEKATRDARQSRSRDVAHSVFDDIRTLLPRAIKIVEQSASKEYPLQWCLRDIHSQNLLFTDDRVTGLVDFGAVAVDSVAGDVARLAESVAATEPQAWNFCVATYNKIHTLTAIERLAIVAFDVGGAIARTANWLRWLFVEQREFADSLQVEQRFTNLVESLHFRARHGHPSVSAAFAAF